MIISWCRVVIDLGRLGISWLRLESGIRRRCMRIFSRSVSIISRVTRCRFMRIRRGCGLFCRLRVLSRTSPVLWRWACMIDSRGCVSLSLGRLISLGRNGGVVYRGRFIMTGLGRCCMPVGCRLAVTFRGSRVAVFSRRGMTVSSLSCMVTGRRFIAAKANHAHQRGHPALALFRAMVCDRRFLAVLAGWRVTMTLGLTVSLRLAMTISRLLTMAVIGFFAMAIGRFFTMRVLGIRLAMTIGLGAVALPFGHLDFRLQAIGLVVELGNQRFDIRLDHVEALAEELPIRRGIAVDVSRGQVARRGGLRHAAWIGHVQNVSANSASTEQRAACRSGLVEHDHLHEIGLFLLLHGLGDAQGCLHPTDSVCGLVRGDVFADPETILPADFHRLHFGAGKAVQFGIGRSKNFVSPEKDGCDARAATPDDEQTAGNQHDLA